MPKTSLTRSECAAPGDTCIRLLSVALVVGLLCAAVVPAHAEVRNPTGVAVIIGNKEYEDDLIPPVSFADRDAAAFRRYVIDVLGYAPENIIEEHNADRRTMERIFGTKDSHERLLWATLEPDGGSEVVVFYSGHGVPGRMEGEERPRGYLLPSDARPEDAARNGYAIDLLYENLGKMWEADSIVVYLDACFSGVSDGGPLLPDASPVYVEAELPAGDSVTVVTAAAAREVASWDRENGHGLFTHHLLDALYGRGDTDADGQVTVEEVSDYLERYMTRAAMRLFDRSQHATVLGPVGVVLARAVEGSFPQRPVLGEEEVAPTAAVAAVAPSGPATPEQVQRDLLLLGMKEANAAGDHEKVLGYAAQLEELGGELSVEARYYRVQAYAHLGRDEEAIEVLTGYLQETGRDGEHYEEALKLLLRLNERLAAEADAFEQAQDTGTAAAYGEYLRTYPAGRHATQARRAQTEAQSREDDAAFARAQATDTAAAYAEYLRRYPDGRHAQEARRLREQKKWRPGKVFQDCNECPEMVVVPAGSYMMGSPGSEEGRDDDEGPVHRVTIAEPFAVGVHEVTFAEWDACVRDGGCGGYRPDDEGWGRGRRPVINVSWENAQRYVRWLSRETGQEYRLLSESEWEYAARAGTATPFHYGRTISTSQANYDGNYTYGAGSEGEYRARTVPVGSFGANGFGLHDVHGNVWEWVEDCWNGSYRGAPSDGSAWQRGNCDRRVVRGGSWYFKPWFLRSANRYWFESVFRNFNLGFRVARTLTS